MRAATQGDTHHSMWIKTVLLTTCRIRNKAKLRALDLVDPRNTELRSTLQKAEMAMTAGGDVVDEDDDEQGGPPSDSD